MKILDRYLILQFIRSVLFGLLAFTLLFLVIDMMENLDDFIDNSVPGGTIFYYYLVFVPEIIKLMTPVAVLFGGLFTAGKMSNQNELTAIKAGGVSVFRFLLPFILTSFILSLGSYYFGGYVVPQANKNKAEIEVKFLKRGVGGPGANLFFQDSLNRIVNLQFYNETNLEALRVSVQEFAPPAYTSITKRIDANRIQFDTVQNAWVAFDGTIRVFTGIKEKVEKFSVKTIPFFKFKPEDLSVKQERLEILTTPELQKLIDDQRKSGYDPRRIEIEYYARFAFPVTNIIVLLFGLPISANKRRGSLALQFGINILITFIYLGMTEIIKAFGKNGSLSPIVTAWFVNTLFCLGAVINLIRVRK